jgi:hypothetical protein
MFTTGVENTTLTPLTSISKSLLLRFPSVLIRASDSTGCCAAFCVPRVYVTFLNFLDCDYSQLNRCCSIDIRQF